MSTPLATLFTKIGFDIDAASLTALNTQLSNLEARFRNLASLMNSAGRGGISRTPSMSAQERQAALAELRQRRLERLQVRANEMNLEFDRRRSAERLRQPVLCYATPPCEPDARSRCVRCPPQTSRSSAP